MKNTYRAVVAIAIIAVVAFAGWRFYESRREKAAGILSENIVHDGSTWTADFSARIPAPEQAVYWSMQNIENSKSDQVKDIKVLEHSGDSKTVEMTMDGPGGQPLVMRLKFHYDPASQTISYQTLDNPTIDTQAQYKLSDEGASTFIDYHQVTKMSQELPVPDGVVKQVIRSIFIAQLEGLQKALHVTTADQSDEDEDN